MPRPECIEIKTLPASYNWTPEKRLLLAILLDAIATINRENPVWIFNRQTHRDQDRHWFNSSSKKPFSFIWCCDNLDLDHKKIRTLANNWPPIKIRRYNQLIHG